MPTELRGSFSGAGLRVALVVSRYNSFITDRLLQGAQRTLKTAGVADEDVTVAYVPGSFEIPLAAKRLAASGQYDAVVCLGCVIKGETDHYEHVSTAATLGILEAGLQTGVPVTFGVLTTENVEQARARAIDGEGNKGAEAAMAALEMANLLRQIPGSGGTAKTT